MAESPDRRAFVDPRYVTREEFDRYARQQEGDQMRRDREGELYRQRVAEELGHQAAEIVKLRVQLARVGVYLSGAIGLVGLVGGPVITWALLHH